MSKPKGSKTSYISKGQRPNVNTKISNLVRQSKEGDKIIRQLASSRKGKNTTITIPNPNREETNKPFIKVRGSDFFRSKEMLKKDKEKRVGS